MFYAPSSLAQIAREREAKFLMSENALTSCLYTSTLVCLIPLFFPLPRFFKLCPLLPPAGEPDAQRLAGDLGVRGRPGRDARGGQQRRADPDGEGRPGLPQTGEGKPHGRMEILHLLRLPGVSHVEETGEEEEEEEQGSGIEGGAGGRWKLRRRCGDGWRKRRKRDVNEMALKEEKKKEEERRRGGCEKRLLFGTLRRVEGRGRRGDVRAM